MKHEAHYIWGLDPKYFNSLMIRINYQQTTRNSYVNIFCQPSNEEHPFSTWTVFTFVESWIGRDLKSPSIVDEENERMRCHCHVDIGSVRPSTGKSLRSVQDSPKHITRPDADDARRPFDALAVGRTEIVSAREFGATRLSIRLIFTGLFFADCRRQFATILRPSAIQPLSNQIHPPKVAQRKNPAGNELQWLDQVKMLYGSSKSQLFRIRWLKICPDQAIEGYLRSHLHTKTIFILFSSQTSPTVSQRRRRYFYPESGQLRASHWSQSAVSGVEAGVGVAVVGGATLRRTALIHPAAVRPATK